MISAPRRSPIVTQKLTSGALERNELPSHARRMPHDKDGLPKRYESPVTEVTESVRNGAEVAERDRG
jgi:hypothetical protein